VRAVAAALFERRARISPDGSLSIQAALNFFVSLHNLARNHDGSVLRLRRV
jgi:hypothetical protein